MSSYLFDSNSPLLNHVFLDTSRFMSPEIETLVETKKILPGIEALMRHSVESVEQRNIMAAHNIQQTINGAQQAFSQSVNALEMGLEQMGRETNEVRRSVQDVGERVSSGMSQLDQTIRNGVGILHNDIGWLGANISTGVTQLSTDIRQVAVSVTQLDRTVQTEFERVNTGLQQGFSGVINAVCVSNTRLGEEIAQGFQGVAAAQHETRMVMDEGFRNLTTRLSAGFVAQIEQTLIEGDKTRAAIRHLGEQVVHEQQLTRQQLSIQHEQLVKVLTEGFSRNLERLAQESLLQREALGQLRVGLQQIGQKLDRLHETLVNRERYEADEAFKIGLRYLNHLRLYDAKIQFCKALDKFGGHYPSLLMLGYIAFLEQEIEQAQNWFAKALSQTGHSGIPDEQAREYACASLYLARLAFTQRKYQEAQTLYNVAYQSYPLFSALIEWAVSGILANSDQEEVAKKTIANRFRQFFDKAYLYWYALALELVVYHPELAVSAFYQGLSNDEKARRLYIDMPKRRAKHVLGVLSILSSRNFQILYELLLREDDLQWLRVV